MEQPTVSKNSRLISGFSVITSAAKRRTSAKTLRRPSRRRYALMVCPLLVLQPTTAWPQGVRTTGNALFSGALMRVLLVAVVRTLWRRVAHLNGSAGVVVT